MPRSNPATSRPSCAGWSTSAIRALEKSTVRAHVAVLRALLGDAKEEGVIRDNPAAGVRVVVPEGDGTARRQPIDKRALTIAELRLLLAALPDRWRLLFELLAHTGLRIGEAIELRWERDVILGDRPHIRLRWQWADGRVCEPKARHGKRDIPLSPGLRASCAPPARPTPTAGSSSARRLADASTGTTSTATSSAPPSAPLASTGSPHTRFATRAHRFSSRRASHGGGGKNVKQVQEWLGHHSAAYTLKEYVHLIDTGVGETAFLDDATAA